MGKKTDKRIEMIECACGCGEVFNKYNGWYEVRRFVSGHNGRIYKNVTKDEARKLTHAKHRALYGEAAKVKAKERRKINKAKILEYKGTKCSHCGLKYDGENGPVFELHHVVASAKLFDVGTNAMLKHTWEEIMKEADKCVVLCANCHRLHHYTDQVPITEKDLYENHNNQ